MRSFVFFCLILLGFATVNQAQAQSEPFSTLDAPQPFPKNFGMIRMAPGTVRLFKATGPVKSVLLARSEVADIALLTGDVFAITAKQIGVSTLIAVGPDNQVTSSGDLVVYPLSASASSFSVPSVSVRAFPAPTVVYNCDPERSINDDHPCAFRSPATAGAAPGAAPQGAAPAPSQPGR